MSLHDGEPTDLGGSNFHGAEAALRRAAQVAHRRAKVAGAETGKPPAFGTMKAPHGSDGDPRKLSFSQAQGYEGRLAYAIDPGPPPTIFPSVTAEEGQAIGASLQTLAQAGLQGSASHLRRSAERINKGDWAGSIRESMHAVESVARQLIPGKSSTLVPVLRSLEKRAALHPALKQALGKLYGYSSDEQGIRHALLDQEQASVGMDEAVFMLGACASFASYLWRKYAAGDNP